MTDDKPAPQEDAPLPLEQRVSEILQAAVSGNEPRYRYEKDYIRWGLVEREIKEAIRAAIAERDAEIRRQREAKEAAVRLWNECGADLAEKDAALRELREASHAYATIVLPSQGEAELEWTRFCAALRRADAALGSEKGATE